MSNLPRGLRELISFFDQLPGIGPKSAARLSLYLFQTPESFLKNFGQAIEGLKTSVKSCSVCFNLDDQSPCRICRSKGRDRTKVCVVERVLDVIALEKTGKYKGLYHVLGGVINPLIQIGPEELNIDPLIKRIRDVDGIREIIFATNPTLEGEATAMYLKKRIEGLSRNGLAMTRIGHGLPFGADLDYADPGTLVQALKGRQKME